MKPAHLGELEVGASVWARWVRVPPTPPPAMATPDLSAPFIAPPISVQHRLDRSTPIEDTIGKLRELIAAGQD